MSGTSGIVTLVIGNGSGGSLWRLLSDDILGHRMTLVLKVWQICRYFDDGLCDRRILTDNNGIMYNLIVNRLLDWWWWLWCDHDFLGGRRIWFSPYVDDHGSPLDCEKR